MIELHCAPISTRNVLIQSSWSVVTHSDANLSSKFLSGKLDNFLALSGQCPDNWTIFA